MVGAIGDPLVYSHPGTDCLAIVTIIFRDEGGTCCSDAMHVHMLWTHIGRSAEMFIVCVCDAAGSSRGG